MTRTCAAFLLLTLPLGVAHSVPLRVAHGAPLRAAHGAPLRKEHQALIENHLAPVVGPKLGRFAAHSEGTSRIVFRHAEDNQPAFTIQRSSKCSVPQHSLECLTLPADFDLASLPDKGKALLQCALVGSWMHPYNPASAVRKQYRDPEQHEAAVARQRAEYMRKDVQQDSIDIATHLYNTGRKKFLTVAPPGVGKTDIIGEVTQYVADNPRPDHPLQIITTDSTMLNSQLAERDIGPELRRRGINVIRWGGGHQSIRIEHLGLNLLQSPQPTVLISTTATLRNQIFKAEPAAGVCTEQAIRDRFAVLRDATSCYTYDEAHHTGAPYALEIVRELIDHPRSVTFLNGATAIPTNRNNEATVQEIFDNHAFFTYIDRKADFLKEGFEGSFDRSIYDLSRQLFAAIDMGELTPSSEPRIPRAENMFTQVGRGRRRIVDPRIYDPLIETLRPDLVTSQRGYITMGLIDEVNQFTTHINKRVPELFFEPMHSNLKLRGADAKLTPTPAQIELMEEDFRSGDTNYRVAITRMDEGMNYPFMNLWVDLNASFTARQFLQRWGRVLRLYPGKRMVDVIMLVPYSEQNMLERMELADAIVDQTEARRRRHESAGGTRPNSPALQKKTAPKKQKEVELQGISDFKQDLVKFRNAQLLKKQRNQKNPGKRMGDVVKTIRAGEADAWNDFDALLQRDIKPHIVASWPDLTPEQVDDVLRVLSKRAHSELPTLRVKPEKYGFLLLRYARASVDSVLHNRPNRWHFEHYNDKETTKTLNRVVRRLLKTRSLDLDETACAEYGEALRQFMGPYLAREFPNFGEEKIDALVHEMFIRSAERLRKTDMAPEHFVQTLKGWAKRFIEDLLTPSTFKEGERLVLADDESVEPEEVHLIEGEDVFQVIPGFVLMSMQRYDGADDPSMIAHRGMATEQLQKVLQTLSYREREIIKLRYGLWDAYEYSLEEVGEVFKVTKERVWQIEHKALRKLQQPSRSQELVDYMDFDWMPSHTTQMDRFIERVGTFYALLKPEQQTRAPCDLTRLVWRTFSADEPTVDLHGRGAKNRREIASLLRKDAIVGHHLVGAQIPPFSREGGNIAQLRARDPNTVRYQRVVPARKSIHLGYQTYVDTWTRAQKSDRVEKLQVTSKGWSTRSGASKDADDAE